jgi:glucose/mannose-6-phosphate isomerase
MTLDDIKRLDPTGMYGWIKGFPQQVEKAVEIGKRSPISLNAKGVRNIVVTGLGGSAIGGDLVRSYLADELKVPFVVSRHYSLPRFVGKDTLVIVSSYSGNTEETISSHRDAARRKARVLCISTGGETERLATRFKHALIRIPPGLSPRAALGYSFFPMLLACVRLGFVKNKPREINETVSLLKAKASLFASVDSPDNAPLQLAKRLHGKLPVIYSPQEHLDAVNLRWRGQIAENAKQLAFGNVLPEMNHNELVGWKVLPDKLRGMEVVFLRDKSTHPRVSVRVDITKHLVSHYAAGVTEVWGEGRSLLARMLSLVHFGDWLSFYLAILNGVDPTPVAAIDHLKSELAKFGPSPHA